MFLVKWLKIILNVEFLSQEPGYWECCRSFINQYVTPNTIFCSNTIRAKQTAEMIYPLFVSLLLDCKITYKYKNYQALQKELVDAVNLFQLHHISDMYIVEKLNCGMYKDVYEQTYNMQEWLRNNDKAGYASFVHACDMTNMDFSKYVEDYVKPNMTDININNYFN